VTDLDVSPDGAKIASIGQDGFVKIWSVEGGDLVTSSTWATTAPMRWHFTDDTGVMVGIAAGLVTVFTIDLVEVARSRLTRSLTDKECRRTCTPTLSVVTGNVCPVRRATINPLPWRTSDAQRDLFDEHLS
jgi:WD40 repeat protein